MNGAVPWSRANSSQTSSVAGSSVGLSTQALGQGQALRAQIDGHDLVDAPVDQCGDRHQPHRATTEHGHFVARYHVRLVDRLHADPERLGEGGDDERHAFGHTEHPLTEERLTQEERWGRSPTGPPLPI